MVHQGTYDLFGQFTQSEREDAFQLADWERTRVFTQRVCAIAAGGLAFDGIVHYFKPALLSQSFGTAAIWLAFGSCLLPLIFLRSPSQRSFLSWTLLAPQIGIYGNVFFSTYFDAQSAPSTTATLIALITLFILMLPGKLLASITLNLIALTLGVSGLFALGQLNAAQTFSVAIVVYLMFLLCILLRKSWNISQRDAFLERGKLEKIQKDLSSQINTSRALLEAGQSYAELITPEGTRIDCNSVATQSHGLEQDGLIGRCVFDEVVNDELADEFRDCVNRAIETGNPAYSEVEYRNRRYRRVCSPVRDSEGAISHIAHFVWDVTKSREREIEIRQAKHEVELANRAQTNFLATMSHELRTPLNAVIGFSEMIEQEILGPVGNAKYSSYATHIRGAGSHLLALLNDILDLSKIEAGKEELFDEEIDVGATLEAIIQIMEGQATAAGVTVNLNVPDTLPVLLADDRRVKQILFNLVSNAVKFTDAGGTVNLKAWWNRSSGLVIQVIDTGIGIAAEDIPKALSPFQQINQNAHLSQEGTGLGLPLTKRLVELHGGSLDLQSKLGVGTTVTVRFPAERIMARSNEPKKESA